MILYHDDCLAHEPGGRHPESSHRLRAVSSAMQSIQGTEILPSPKASLEQIERVHDPSYWQHVLESEPRENSFPLDADTLISAGSVDACLRGSGAACFAIDQIFAGKASNAFCATRPPGHHAESARAMGFCVVNHVAVAARHALVCHPVERVAILDFDVHHGNGTQAIFESSPEVLFVSSHQIPLYPGTGLAEETGVGNIFNLPLEPESKAEAFRQVWLETGLPAVQAFDPDLILISAGFDAHKNDRLGNLNLLEEDYSWITKEIGKQAAKSCDGRIVSVLEGGYNLEALASSSRAHVEALVSASPRC